MLHRALDNALRLELVQRNVCDLVDPPRMRHYLALALTPAQARSLLEAAKGDPLEALFVVALNTGMRLGELLALRWQFVDLDGGSLQVHATLRRAPNGFVFAEPKTEHSRRQVMLTSQAVETLRQQRVRQVEQKAALGAAWEESDLVFPKLYWQAARIRQRTSAQLLAATEAGMFATHSVPRLTAHGGHLAPPSRSAS